MLKYDTANDEQKKSLPYLDNKLGIVDIKDCKEKESKISAQRALELLESGKLKNMPLNAKTLCYIHKILFQDIYPWAGEYRTTNITKGETLFFNVEFLRYGSDELFNNLAKDKFLTKLSKMEFVELFSYYANELNFLHPFREGNGRTKKIFLSELARRAGFEIDFKNITHDQLKLAEVSAIGVGVPKVQNMAILKNLYNENIVDKRSEPYKPKVKTVEQIINRILWIYDRESTVNWMSNFNSLIEGENAVKQKLALKSGKEELCQFLRRSKKGAKPTKILKVIDTLIKQISQANENILEDTKNIEY